MPIKTLGGIFDEPKKTSKRNFIRENVRSVRQLQGIVRGFRDDAVLKSRTSNNVSSSINDINSWRLGDKINLKSNSTKKQKTNSALPPKQTFSNRSVQTVESEFDKIDNITVPPLNFNEHVSLEKDIADLTINDKQANNKCSIDTSPSDSSADCTVDKNNTKYEKIEEEECFDPFCPPGHRLLAEEERKLTLKNLKENYLKRIKELNSLSLNSDTLRIQRKRTEIENDLKRIDAGINIFDKTKVYIKV